MQETIRKFKEILAKRDAYQHALGVLQYDSETAMPRAGRDARRSSISARPARSIMAVDSSEMSRRGERARAPASARR